MAWLSVGSEALGFGMRSKFVQHVAVCLDLDLILEHFLPIGVDEVAAAGLVVVGPLHL